MVCKGCHREFEGEFCPYCGKAAPGEVRFQKAEDLPDVPMTRQAPPPPVPQNPKKNGKPKKRRLWVIFLVLGLVLAVGAAGLGWWIWSSQDVPEVISATSCSDGGNHKFRKKTTEADCTQRGYTTETCRKCGYTYMYNMVSALGHQWKEPVSVKELSCTTDGLQSVSCSRCGLTREEPVSHTGHSYVLSSAEGDEEKETVEYVCSVCGEKITLNRDEPLPREQKEKTYLPNCSEDFTFLVSCDQGEDYLRQNLTLTGEAGAVAYDVEAEAEGTYRIAVTEPYQQYQTYQVGLSDDMTLPEYNAKSLEFSIVGPDRSEVVFNEDNLVFLKALEMAAYGASGQYELQWDEAAQRYYLTLFRLADVDSSLVGKVIGIGDYTNTEEILEDSTRQLQFAKLEKISHNAEGQILLELSLPQLSEVYDKLDVYFAGNVDELQVNGDTEQAFLNAVSSSEGFTEYVTAVHLAADSYARDHGLVVTPLAETSKDKLQFKLTKHSLGKGDADNECKLELGGEITYTVPMKSKGGHASGSVVMTCNAEIIATIAAGGDFKDKDSVNLYLINATQTTLGFKMDFRLEYSQDYEQTYLVHKTTKKIHTATCRIANKETNSANLERLTAQQLAERYNGDKVVMKQDECKICLAVTGLDGTAYAYNKNTGVLHCMNCRHVDNIKDCNLYTLHPANTFTFTNCEDCKPQERQVKDFDNRMMNALKGSDWGEQVQSVREMLGDSIGDQKPSTETDPNLTIPINVAGVFNIEIGVAPVFEFNMEASVNFTITARTVNSYGIRSVGKGFETYNHEYPGKVDYELKFTGEANAKFGINLVVKAYPVGCSEFAYIEIKGQVGLYGRFTGIFNVEGTVGGDVDTYCAARLEAGLYAKIDGYWKILWFDGDFEILKEQRLPLFKWGYDRMYYAFENEEVEVTTEDAGDFTYYDFSMFMKAKYLDLTTMKEETGIISPRKKSMWNVAVDIKNEDGSSCDFLEYVSENGVIHKKDSAPESFTAVMTVQVTPKVTINSLKDFLSSETKELQYGCSLDPLVIKVKVGKAQEQKPEEQKPEEQKPEEQKPDQSQKPLSRIDYYDAAGERIYYECYTYYDTGLLCSTTLFEETEWGAAYRYTFLYLYDDQGNQTEKILDVPFELFWYDQEKGQIEWERGSEYIAPEQESIEQEKFGVDPSKTQKIYGDAMVISTDPTGDWAQAYLDDALSGDIPTDSIECVFMYINDDAVPELWVDYSYGYAGAKVLTAKDGKADSVYISHGSASWHERENLLFTSGGHMGSYSQEIHKIHNGIFELVASGEYYEIHDENGIRYDEDGHIMYEYQWNDTVVSEEEYQKQLSSVFDESIAVSRDYHFYSYNQCKRLLQYIQSGNAQAVSGDEPGTEAWEEAMLGTYKGSYFANQGETGLTLTVYQEGEQCKALFDFYNLPGKTNAKSGRYYMDVSYDDSTEEYTFTATEWVERPSDYDFVNLKGQLAGDVLNGNDPTVFTVTKTTVPEQTEISLEDMPIVAHGSYQGNMGDSTIYNLNRNGLSTYDRGEAFGNNGNVGVDGTTYYHGFEAWIARWNYTDECSWAYATFDLAGQYKTLTGKTNLITSYNTEHFDTNVYFYDGETLLASYRLTDSDYIKDISVDVTGVNHLTLRLEDNVAVSGGTSFALYDMFLFTDGTEKINDLYDIYKQVLLDNDFSQNSIYTLYDINQDDIPELIVGNRTFYVYTYDNKKCVLCGELYAYANEQHASLYAYDGNGIIAHDGGMGKLHLEYVNLYTLSDGSLKHEKNICSTEEYTYDELTATLSTYEKIAHFSSINDDALLKQLIG